MIIDFKGLLDAMEDDDIFTRANEARPGSNYLYNAILPDQLRRGYSAKSSSMSIRATMAKLVGMDSKYPKGGAARRSQFEHRIAKLAIEMPFPEEYLRELRELVNDAFNNTIDDELQVLETMFNFTDKLLVQPILDTSEWLKGQALITGEIDWQSDDIKLEVDYGIPAANFLTTRTGNDAYGGSTSKFWVDWHEVQRILKRRVRLVLMTSTTLDEIIYNPVNNIRIISGDDVNGIFQLQRILIRNGVEVQSDDIRDRITVITYDDNGEVLDDTKPGSGETILVPMCPDGSILVIGQNDDREFRVGTGSTREDDTPVTVGYNHIGPTEEGNGRLGRWATAYVPQGDEYMFVAKSAQNSLPVITRPDLVVNMTTDIA
ncbi:MAG: major capsid protein [Leuconostoc mesenteroides]